MNSEKGYQKKVNTTRHKRKKVDSASLIPQSHQLKMGSEK